MSHVNRNSRYYFMASKKPKPMFLSWCLEKDQCPGVINHSFELYERQCPLVLNVFYHLSQMFWT